MLALVALCPPSRGIGPFRTEIGRRISYYMGVKHHLMLSRCYCDYLLNKATPAVTRDVLRRAGNDLISRLPGDVKTLLIETSALREGLQIDAEPFEPMELSDLLVYPFPSVKDSWWDDPENRLIALNTLSDIAEASGLHEPVTRKREKHSWRKGV